MVEEPDDVKPPVKADAQKGPAIFVDGKGFSNTEQRGCMNADPTDGTAPAATLG
jgi:hypothetical protein